MLRLHNVPGDPGGPGSGHRGPTGIDVKQRRGTGGASSERDGPGGAVTARYVSVHQGRWEHCVIIAYTQYSYV